MALISRSTGCGKKSWHSLPSKNLSHIPLQSPSHQTGDSKIAFLTGDSASWIILSINKSCFGLLFPKSTILFFFPLLFEPYFHWRWPGCLETRISNCVFRSEIFTKKFFIKNVRLLSLLVLDIIWVRSSVQRVTFLKVKKLSLYWGKSLNLLSRYKSLLWLLLKSLILINQGSLPRNIQLFG